MSDKILGSKGLIIVESTLIYMDIFDTLDLQMKRKAAYEDGNYELSSWEGFTCTECDNRQLSARADLECEDELLRSVCDECDGKMETPEEDTDWDAVREKIPTEYLEGDAMETDLPECPKCGSDIKEEGETAEITFRDQTVELHKRCGEALWEGEVENPHWYDTFTPDHYEKAADYLRSLECVGCVITNNGNSYPFGEMYIHTNFCTTTVVQDVIDDFNGRIISAKVVEEDDDDQFACVGEHGTCFEILIDFCTDGSGRMPPESLDRYSRDEGPSWSQDHFLLDYDNTPFFDADFSKVRDRGPEKVPDKHRD